MLFLQKGTQVDENDCRSFVEELHQQSNDPLFRILRSDTWNLHAEIINICRPTSMPQEEPLKATIYVAHHQRDAAHADRLIKRLKIHGARKIQSPALPDPGSSQYDKIIRNVHRGLLDASNGVLVVFSEDDDWLYSENVTWIDKQATRRSRNARVNLKRRAVYAASPRASDGPPPGRT